MPSQEKKNPNDNTDEKPLAYFKAVVRNGQKMEYRQNANAAKHISPTGIWFDGYKAPFACTEDIEQEISVQNSADWLLFINNENLYAALSNLKPKDVEFIFTFYKFGFTERQMAKHLGISQNTVHKRRKRILKMLKSFF